MTNSAVDKSVASGRPKPLIQRLKKIAIVLIGIIIGQAVLYGPSLVGNKILLPLDLLLSPGNYTPVHPGISTELQNRVLFDLITFNEPKRCFDYNELHSGRMPFFDPHMFAGAPTVYSHFSPVMFLLASVKSPVIIPWVTVLLAMIGGAGAYFFFRRVLRLAFWPSAIIAWCYPFTAFFILWQGYELPNAVCLLPWSFLVVHGAVKNPRGFAGIKLAAITLLILTVGQVDISCQVLLVSGFFAIWCLLTMYFKKWFSRQVLRAVTVLLAGWSIAFLLFMPDLLPNMEFIRTGERTVSRMAGSEERPPVGLAALPETVLPFVYGCDEKGSLPLHLPGEGNLQESAATAYSGIIAALFLAPLCWGNRRRRGISIFLMFLSFFSLGWILNIPGIVQFLRLPLLNMMSHNRLVFAFSFSIIALAAIGFHNLWRGHVRWQRWHWIPALLLAGISIWCFFRALLPPEPVATQISAAVLSGNSINSVRTLADVHEVQGWFMKSYLRGSLLALLGFIGWMIIAAYHRSIPRFFPVCVGALLLIELLIFDYGQNPQCAPSLYFPKIPVLDAIAKSEPGRIVGMYCLPARFAEMAGLSDIRGYDGVDNARLMDIMDIAAASNTTKFTYSWTQYFTPKITVADNHISISPILDMLNVRYLIFRGKPLNGVRPDFEGDDYWVLVNHSALPRVFIPKKVTLMEDSRKRLELMASANFNASEESFVETPAVLPPLCTGSAKIVSETPQRINITAEMATPGLLVLSDLWDVGWHAYIEGHEVPILRTNHAIRGVVVPSSMSQLEFRYAPKSRQYGIYLAAFGLIQLLTWSTWIYLKKRNKVPGKAIPRD